MNGKDFTPYSMHPSTVIGGGLMLRMPDTSAHYKKSAVHVKSFEEITIPPTSLNWRQHPQNTHRNPALHASFTSSLSNVIMQTPKEVDKDQELRYYFPDCFRICHFVCCLCFFADPGSFFLNDE
eukprot:scpid63419/ scgid26107/ 